MKRYQTLLTVLFILIGAVWASADFYIVDSDNKVVAKTNYQPSQQELDSRGEIAVFTKDDVELMEAEYRNGKIVKHEKTTNELKVEKEHKDKNDEMSLIRRRALYDACLSLEAEGVIFKQIKCKDFE